MEIGLREIFNLYCVDTITVLEIVLLSRSRVSKFY